ncbi:uncharacterized protein LOC121368301 [Gigantopelta aegis]|uniref:uncharacterized protein LOC121368301 n=1 Tax=Gigantopelta aegis TaxID=1735272 RepID=UPI001B88D5F4|nr:uncharacterized protein LOC121368301 [Gigantopelta aegis]
MSNIPSRPGTKKSQKVHYRPSTNASIRPNPPGHIPRRLSTRGSIKPLSEADTAAETVLTEATSFIPRASYQAPRGCDPRLVHLIQKYLDKTQLEVNFRSLLGILLNRNDLPYNPYPGLTVRLRPYSEKFYMDSFTAEHIEYALGMALQETQLLNLFTVKDNPFVWGLSSVLRCVDAGVLQRYRWLLDNLTPNPEDVNTEEDYTVQVMTALVGQTVFQGTFYTHTHCVEVRLEYLITGPDLSQGLSVFVNSVMKDIDGLVSHSHHKLLGINVPVQITEDGKVWEHDFWDPQRLDTDKGMFLQIVSDAVIGNKYILVECVFQLNPLQSTYIRGRKQYGMNFIQLVDDMREEGLSSFTEFPMSTLHEGVFLNQAHAESYILMFMPQIAHVDTQNIQLASARAASQMTEASRPRNRRNSTLESDRHSIHIHVHGRLEHFRPRKIRIDGFKLGNDPGYGPFAWQIVTPFKNHLQREMAAHHPQVDLFDIIYNAILLVLTDRILHQKEILHEIYRVLHSTVGRLHQLTEHNKAIRALMRGFADTDDVYFIRHLLGGLKRDTEELLANSLQERSNDMTTVGQAMSGLIDELLSPTDFVFGSSTHLQQIVQTLRSMDNYCTTLLIQLAEDTTQWCPSFQELLTKIQDTFPEDIKRPETRLKKQRDHKRTGLRSWEADSIFRHGKEEEHIMKHEDFVLNVQMCIERDTSPKIMTVESVLMKYLIDTHLDEVWHSFLIELFLNQYLLPNPYPRLISRLRQGAMRMDLCYEKSSGVLKRILSGNPQLVDPDNYIYQLPACEGFGIKSILSILDVGSYVPVAQMVREKFQPKNYIQRKGPYRVGICLAIAGQTTLYGKLQPYLNEVELHEHYYIQGPRGSNREVHQLFTRIVYSHVVDLIKENAYPVLGVYMGEDHIRWTWEDILNKQQPFSNEFEMVCSRSEPIYFKAYVLMDGWRYVAVKKYFLLHFLTDDGLVKEQYFPDNPQAFYQSVFLTKERAAFHYQNCGLRSGNPLSVPNVRVAQHSLDKQLMKAAEKCQWLSVHRQLLIRALMRQEKNERLVESWRMLHSMAGQAEYICFLIEALQDLVTFALEYAKWLELEEEQQSTVVSGKQKQDPLDLRILSQMTMAFHQKLTIVCDWRISMAADVFCDYILDKLKEVEEKDSVTGELFVALEEETVPRLEYVKDMIRAIQDMLSGDVHNISPEAQSVVSNIEANVDIRPSSVESFRLDNPDQYQKRPKANHRIVVEDDLLYRPRQRQLMFR